MTFWWLGFRLVYMFPLPTSDLADPLARLNVALDSGDRVSVARAAGAFIQAWTDGCQAPPAAPAVESYRFHAGSMAEELAPIPADSRPVRYSYDRTGQILRAHVGRTRAEILDRASQRRSAQLADRARRTELLPALSFGPAR